MSGLLAFYQRGLKKVKHTVLVLSLALSGCRSQVAPASPTPEITSLRLYTDGATAPLLRDLVSQYRPSNLLISWDIQVMEPPGLFAWLRSGASTYALTSWTLADDLAQNEWWATPVGLDGVAFVVNRSNPITSLSPAQLRAILQGRVTNWLGVGGENLPLTVIARPPESTAAHLVQQIVLGERRTTRNARLAPTDEAVIALVQETEGAIGYVSMGYLDAAYLDDDVRPVPLENIAPRPESITTNEYPIRAPVLFVGRQPPGDDAYRAFFAWVQSPDGQAVVQKHYGTLHPK
jgi:hypothetical protein